MNQPKKTLDLIASIVSIILGGYLVLGSSMIVAISSNFDSESGFARALMEAFLNYSTKLLVMGILIFIASILLIVAAIKNWKFVPRLIFEIVLAALMLGMGLYYAFSLKEAGWLMIYIMPTIILIISMFLKNDNVNI